MKWERARTQRMLAHICQMHKDEIEQLPATTLVLVTFPCSSAVSWCHAVRCLAKTVALTCVGDTTLWRRSVGVATRGMRALGRSSPAPVPQIAAHMGEFTSSEEDSSSGEPPSGGIPGVTAHMGNADAPSNPFPAPPFAFGSMPYTNTQPYFTPYPPVIAHFPSGSNRWDEVNRSFIPVSQPTSPGAQQVCLPSQAVLHTILQCLLRFTHACTYCSLEHETLRQGTVHLVWDFGIDVVGSPCATGHHMGTQYGLHLLSWMCADGSLAPLLQAPAQRLPGQAQPAPVAMAPGALQQYRMLSSFPGGASMQLLAQPLPLPQVPSSTVQLLVQASAGASPMAGQQASPAPQV